MYVHRTHTAAYRARAKSRQIQGCSEKTDTFVLLPTSLFMVQQLRNGDQMKARENAICASTNPSCRRVSCISLQHMFQMGAFSHHAQLCSLAHFLDHVAAHFWRDRLNGTGDGLLQLWNILGVVFEYSILQVPPKKKVRRCQVGRSWGPLMDGLL